MLKLLKCSVCGKEIDYPYTTHVIKNEIVLCDACFKVSTKEAKKK